MTAIGPGDWVECVDTGPVNFPTIAPTGNPISVLVLGAVYQVAAIIPSLQLRPMLQLREVRSLHNPLGAFYAHRFRPIYRPKADLVERLMQPVDESVRETA